MDELGALFVRMFVIGVAVAAPVGAMGILCIQRTISHGWKSGVVTGLGIAMADALFAALAAFGITAISDLLVSYQAPLRIAGGVGLLLLAWRALTAHPESMSNAETLSIPRTFVSALGLTLTNPMTIIAFSAIFAGAGLVSQSTWQGAVTVTAGVALGSLAWWVALSVSVATIRHGLSQSVMVWINRVSGAVLAAFGVVAAVSGLTTLS